jgi:hypothetical protein
MAVTSLVATAQDAADGRARQAEAPRDLRPAQALPAQALEFRRLLLVKRAADHPGSTMRRRAGVLLADGGRPPVYQARSGRTAIANHSQAASAASCFSDGSRCASSLPAHTHAQRSSMRRERCRAVQVGRLRLTNGHVAHAPESAAIVDRGRSG